MKSKLISLAMLLFATTMSAQVGINTKTPQSTLHVEGNMRVRELNDKSQAPAYDKILVVNASGKVDYIAKKDLRPIGDEFTSDKQVLNNIYTTTNGKADDSKFVSCGKFDFAFRNAGSAINIQYKLTNDPVNDVTVYMTLEQNWKPNGYEFQAPQTGEKFSSNTNSFVNLPISGAGIVNGELNILYLLYPGDRDLYRLTFYRLDQSTSPSTYDFVTACEKF